MLEFKYLVGPGWWPIIDHHFAKAKEIDPECELYEVKQKYGTLRAYFETKRPDLRKDLQKICADMANDALNVCEECGAPGSFVEQNGWVYTLCARCAGLASEERCKVTEETILQYYHGSRLRTQKTEWLETVRQKKLTDFLDDIAKKQGSEAMALNKQLQQDPAAAVPENISQHVMDLIYGDMGV